ncbi:hypothetical protein ACC719_07945 [Rhizobium ruizarguesonis]
MRLHAPAFPLLLALASSAGAQEAHDAVNEANNPLTPKITINLQDYYIPSFIDTPGEPEANQFLLRGHPIGHVRAAAAFSLHTSDRDVPRCSKRICHGAR